MRKLTLNDVMLLSKIFHKINLTFNFDVNKFMESQKQINKKHYSNAILDGNNELVSSNDLVERVGGQVFLDVINQIISKMYLAQDEIFELISSVSGDTVEKVSAYTLEQVYEFFNELVKQQDFPTFFRNLQKFN